MKKLILNLIVGNEDPRIFKRCLESWKPYVDDIIVGFNGDDIKIEELLKEYKCNYFKSKWENNFSKARNEVLDKTPNDCLVAWCDSDDILIGGEKLKESLELAFSVPDIIGLACEWYYAHDNNGNCTASLWRERIVLRDLHKWIPNPAHETLEAIDNKNGVIVTIDDIKIKHLATHQKMARTGQRNLNIIKEQYYDEAKVGKLTSKTVFDIARSYEGVGEFDKAIEKFKDYIKMGISDEEKSIAYTTMGEIYRFQKKYEESLKSFIEVMLYGSNIPDGYVDYAFTLFLQEKYHPCRVFLEMSFKFPPCKSFPIDPTKYSLKPMKLLGVCYLMEGKYKEAIACAEYVLTKMKDEPVMLNVVKISKESIKELEDFDKAKKDEK